mmetsp:Transcript_35193/g.75152  ORF Transcript_35193/g.75152 Transcript_35193/m.75152 type:complete len:219 (-) Transcript_35193:270-926(-)
MKDASALCMRSPASLGSSSSRTTPTTTCSTRPCASAASYRWTRTGASCASTPSQRFSPAVFASAGPPVLLSSCKSLSSTRRRRRCIRMASRRRSSPASSTAGPPSTRATPSSASGRTRARWLASTRGGETRFWRRLSATSEASPSGRCPPPACSSGSSCSASTIRRSSSWSARSTPRCSSCRAAASCPTPLPPRTCARPSAQRRPRRWTLPWNASPLC